MCSVKQQEVFRKKPLASKDDFSNELLVFYNQKKKKKKAAPKADYPLFFDGLMYIYLFIFISEAEKSVLK